MNHLEATGGTGSWKLEAFCLGAPWGLRGAVSEAKMREGARKGRRKQARALVRAFEAFLPRCVSLLAETCQPVPALKENEENSKGPKWPQLSKAFKKK